MEDRHQIEMTNFVNGQPIIGKPAIFDRSDRFKPWRFFFFLIMIPVIYKFYQKKKYRGTTFALLYAKHRDELKRGSGQGNQTQTVK